MPRKLFSLCCFVPGLLFAAACSSPPATPPVESPNLEKVSYEIQGEDLWVRSEVDGVRVVETTPETRTVFSIDKGESRRFPIDSRIEVYGHFLTFDCMPDPSKCPTPKPIPTATFPTEGGLLTCLCFGTPSEALCAKPPDECIRRCCGR